MAATRNPLVGPTERKAMASLVLGISAFAVGPLTGLPAIAVGSNARRRMAASGSKRGKLLAGAGTIVGFFGTGFFFVGLMYFGNAFLGSHAATAQLHASALDSKAKMTAPIAAPKPAAHHDTEMMHVSARR